MKYAALIENGVVANVICGDADWASSSFPGVWVDGSGAKPSKGYLYVDGEFRYPATYPSWVWVDGEWVAPKPQPDPVEGGGWDWDEDAGDWTFVTAPED